MESPDRNGGRHVRHSALDRRSTRRAQEQGHWGELAGKVASTGFLEVYLQVTVVSVR